MASNPEHICWGLIGALLAYEAWALEARRKAGTEDDTITHIVVRKVPWYVVLPFLGWLFIHFYLRFFEPLEEHTI